MSLTTDRLFFAALKADETLMSVTESRIFNTVRPTADEKEDRLPYVIITFDGMQNGETTKDDPYEGATDKVSVGVLCVAKDREELGELTARVRKVIHRQFTWASCYEQLADSDSNALETADEFRLLVMRDSDAIRAEVPYYYDLTAEGVMYDDLNPCFYQQLHYDCDVVNTVYDNEQED